MSAYGSGTGPEYLDDFEGPWDEDGLRIFPYVVTSDEGTTGYDDYIDASRIADALAARGIAVALTVAGEALWSFEPGRADEPWGDEHEEGT